MSSLVLVTLVLAAGIAIVLGLRRRKLIFGLWLAFIALASLVSIALVGLTDGRVAFDESFPWLILVGVCGAAISVAVMIRGKSPEDKASGTDQRVPTRSPVVTSANERPEQMHLSDRKRQLIFISYRRNDTNDVVGRIYDRLIQHFGAGSTFKDVDSIPLGVDYRKHLSDSVGQCDVLLAVIGREWLTGGQERDARAIDSTRDYVRIEIETAIERQIPVIPLLVQKADVPLEEQLPESLKAIAYFNGLPIRPDPDFNRDIARLIEGIERHLSVNE